MRRISRIVLLATLVMAAPVLSGCADFDIDKLDVFGLNEKKKLPGERKPVFPEGVPGVTQGIPPEYMKGNQQPLTDSALLAQPSTPESGPQPAAAEPAKKNAAVEPDGEPKPKIRKPKVAKQKLIPDNQPKPAQNQQQGQQQAPWPDQQQQPQQQPPQQSSSAPWPASPPTGTFSR
jgi:hypothetical protein